MEKKLCKSKKNKMFCGVCAGIAQYIGCDPTVVRLISVALGLIKGFGVFLYIIAAFLIPYDESDFSSQENESFNEASSDKKDCDAKNSLNKGKNQNKKNPPHTDAEFDAFFKKS